MDSEGQARLSRACRLLLPGPDMDEDDGEVVISIRPKSSPLPRRRSSLSDDDSEPELPPCASRRVSFADAKGLSLVQVKEFDLWDVPNPPGMECLDDEGLSTEEYCLSPLTFQLPLSPEDLLVRVQEQKIELESLELIPGTSTLKGLICVLNMSFHKAVYVRTTLDCWASHFDLLTEYIPESGNAHTDRFSFKLTLVPPFREQGSRVDFCLRYETPVGTFWANNNHRNYILFCHQRAKEPREKPQTQTAQKKSCLKTLRYDGAL
ncbi:protein phosphatase 1 regulatory subunit 3A-like [Hippocampus comes]|uniref:protein phosphatase 1 regulatory subunit 3A-like n=1 Tax=Hippocampus comes TaxID=109280 RepID=UPI00094E3313|nr:PREDICTED: protein phosphatase 1 regulatory subunit 3A-like [Hippocampus comes]